VESDESEEPEEAKGSEDSTDNFNDTVDEDIGKDNEEYSIEDDSRSDDDNNTSNISSDTSGTSDDISILPTLSFSSLPTVLNFISSTPITSLSKYHKRYLISIQFSSHSLNYGLEIMKETHFILSTEI
jgi:hypothetical protein